ncbi:hypothetical protein KM043_013269 [Ampulex compressa]|nr:hypothetical protein KM043_013269 [Ampulex compressa]
MLQAKNVSGSGKVIIEPSIQMLTLQKVKRIKNPVNGGAMEIGRECAGDMSENHSRERRADGSQPGLDANEAGGRNVSNEFYRLPQYSNVTLLDVNATDEFDSFYFYELSVTCSRITSERNTHCAYPLPRFSHGFCD